MHMIFRRGFPPFAYGYSCIYLFELCFTRKSQIVYYFDDDQHYGGRKSTIKSM